MTRLILTLIWIFAFFAFLTYVLHRVFPKKKYVKYVLLLFLLAGSAYQFYLSRQAGQGFEDLGFLLLSIMYFIGFLATALTGFILDRFFPRNNK